MLQDIATRLAFRDPANIIVIEFFIQYLVKLNLHDIALKLLRSLIRLPTQLFNLTLGRFNRRQVIHPVRTGDGYGVLPALLIWRA